MKKYFIEAIGSFFLTMVWIVSWQGGNAAGWAALAMGMTLAALLYSARQFSGGHFNPAISIAALMRGKIDRLVLPYYILSQLIGGLLAALAAYFILACQGVVDFRMLSGLDPFCALPAEFFGAFGLGIVYMRAMDQPDSDPSIAAAAALSAFSLVFAPVSGAIFNPALAIGACLAGAVEWSALWLHLLGPILGAAAAASVWMWMDEPERV